MGGLAEGGSECAPWSSLAGTFGKQRMIWIPLVDPASAVAQLFRQFRGTGYHADKTPQHPHDANGAGKQHRHHGEGVQQKEAVIDVRKKSEQSQSIGCKRMGKDLHRACLELPQSLNCDSSMKARQF